MPALVTPSIGSIGAHTINGIARPGKNMVTEFDQFGADGVGLIVGPKRQPVSKLQSTHFIADRAAADTMKKDAAALIGTAVTVTRDVALTPVTIDNCLIKDVTVDEDQAAFSAYGGWKLMMSWDLYVPIDW